MADTTFVNGTVVQPDWLNAINRFVYDSQLPGNSTGSALHAFLQAGTGAVGTTTQTKLRQTINVADFGAPTSGDATAAFQAALNYASTLNGATVYFRGIYSILSNLTVPKNVALMGDLVSPGQQQAGGTGGDYDSLGSVLKVSSTATITLNHAASLTKCVVIRSGLDLPFANLAAAQDGVAAFAGTAVTIGGDDVLVEHVLFLGFEKAIVSNNRQRMRFYNVQGDCTNGIEIANSLDVVYLDHCHFWPFTTANYSWTADDTTQKILTRTGIAFHLLTRTDWVQITNCFSYGYFRGMRLHNANSVRVTAVAHDCPVSGTSPAYAGSIGFLIEGTSVDAKFVNCYTAGKTDGYNNNADAGGHNEFTSCDAIACTIGMYIKNAQDVTINTGLLRACAYGIEVGNATANVKIRGTRIRDYTTKPMNVAVATSRIEAINIDFVAPSGGASMTDNPSNWTLPTVASADPLHLPGHLGNVFIISGTSNFGSMSGGYPGRRITLLFSAALTVLNGSGIRLNGSANFAAAAGSSLTLVWTGSQWREVGRCA